VCAQLPLAVPVIYFLIVTLLVAVPLVTKPRESAIGLIMMLGTGVAYYLLVIAWTSKPAVLVNKMGTSRLSHYFAPFPRRGAKYYDQCVCTSECPFTYLGNYTSKPPNVLFVILFKRHRQRAQATYMPVKSSTMNTYMLDNETR